MCESRYFCNLLAILFWSQFLRIILSPVMVCLPTKVGRVMKTLWSIDSCLLLPDSESCCFVLNCVGLALNRVGLVLTCIDLSLHASGSCWFVLTRAGIYVAMKIKQCDSNLVSTKRNLLIVIFMYTSIRAKIFSGMAFVIFIQTSTKN